MIFGKKFVADMIDGAPPDAQLRKTYHHDGYHNYGRIEPKTCSTKKACKDYACGKVAGRHREVAAQDAKDVTQIGSFRQRSQNKKRVNLAANLEE